MSKKKKILLVGIILFAIIIAILYFTTDKDISNKVVNYIEKLGFTNTDDVNIYSKLVSSYDIDDFNNYVKENQDVEYEKMFFNVESFEFYKDQRSYFNGVTTSFLPIYNYTNNELKYSYRINSNNLNIIINGTYEKENDYFSCNVTFSSDEGINDKKNDICESLNYKIKDFYYEAFTLIQSSSILDEIENNN